MAAEASTPRTVPLGTRAAISAVVLPFPQPISRMRSFPLRSSRARTSSAIAACRAERRAYSEAFHSVITCAPVFGRCCGTFGYTSNDPNQIYRMGRGRERSDQHQCSRLGNAAAILIFLLG